MKYWRISMENGYCGFDDEFLMEQEEEPTFDECFAVYTYAEGGGGLDPYDGEEFADYDEYEDAVCDNTFVEEITEDEFNQYQADGWEVR